MLHCKPTEFLQLLLIRNNDVGKWMAANQLKLN